MILTCPWCGPRNVEEFSFGGDASVKRPHFDDPSLTRWQVATFERDNPRGPHREFWHHEAGCRQWLVAERNTATHEMISVRSAREARR